MAELNQEEKDVVIPEATFNAIISHLGTMPYVGAAPVIQTLMQLPKVKAYLELKKQGKPANGAK